MKFKDQEIEKLDLTNVDDIIRLISEFLCGKTYCKQLCENDKKLISNLLSNLKHEKINFEQFNEFLLLLNQDRISEDFFEFLFMKNTISLHDLKEGIIKFRGCSIVCFGNFKSAYEQLSNKNKKYLDKVLASFCRESESILHEFEKRPSPMLRIEPISRDETWYIGYISQKKYKKEKNYLENLLFSKQKKKINFLKISQKYLEMAEIIKRVDEKALRNTNIYLTWDYMDVYLATSMRHKWEFQEVFDFTKELFNDSNLKNLKLRYFDPTQSKCKDRIDKGLIEGLMLKRVLCSIYMAQESDTMGKDSELASTLAQGKPVIAYVPKIDIDSYSEKIKKYPLDYFEKRLLILQAEGAFLEDEKCYNELKSYDQEFLKKIEKFIKNLDKHRRTHHFSLLEEEEEKFKINSAYFSGICKILAIAEHYSFERRADTLKKNHPLAIQVDLQYGVANGVLVVRHIKECADLLKRILTNSMEFTIKHIGEKGKGITILEEKISKSPFRVVTDDEKLTNSFWNFYLNLQIK